MAAFGDTPFEASLVAALSAVFPSPSPIQAAAWPVVLAGDDLIAVAKTGSGKTLGFLLPAFHALGSQKQSSSSSTKIFALVLAPTRELALQISGECDKFSASSGGISSLCVYGGVPIGAQQRALAATGSGSKGAVRVVIATPGRLCDLITRGSVDLSTVKYAVLDEADRMLDMGFEPQITQIFACCAAVDQGRQTLCFTATWPKAVRKLAEKYMRPDAKKVFVGNNGGSSSSSSGSGASDDAFGGGGEMELEANTAVSQTFIEAQDDEKDNKLWALLSDFSENSRVVVFANTKRRVDVCARTFGAFGACAIHGDKRQASP